MKPKRIQRKRTKGWRMPKNTVYVGRPSKWGNPFHYKDGHDTFRYWGYLAFFWVKKMVIKRELKGKNLCCWCPLRDKYGKIVPCHADILLEIANS